MAERTEMRACLRETDKDAQRCVRDGGGSEMTEACISCFYKRRILTHGAFFSVTAQFNEAQRGTNCDH